MKNKVRIIGLLLVIPVISALCLELWARRNPLLISQNEGQISLEPGESLPSFGAKLQQNGLVSSSFLFGLYVRLRSDYSKFQAGSYRFSQGISPRRLIQLVKKGEVYHELSLKITVPEGAQLREIISSLKNFGYSAQELYNLAEDSIFLQNLGIQASSLEGYLYPSTYSFYDEKPSARIVLKAMVDKFFSSLPKDYQSSLMRQNLSLHQAVIIASLIEKETSLSFEKPKVAETIRNRLQNRMHLGIDASIIYGLKNFSGTLSKIDLQDKENIYNTRVHYGLPPGPIASPSLSSLQAVVKPSEDGYFYYVLKPGPGQKEHHFSRSFAEHKIYVQKLRSSRKQQNLK